MDYKRFYFQNYDQNSTSSEKLKLKYFTDSDGVDKQAIYINTKTGDNNLNFNIEGQTINNLTINNLNSSNILLNDNSVQTFIDNTTSTDSKQNLQIQYILKLLNAIYHDLQEYIVPQILTNQYMYVVSKALPNVSSTSIYVADENHELVKTISYMQPEDTITDLPSNNISIPRIIQYNSYNYGTYNEYSCYFQELVNSINVPNYDDTSTQKLETIYCYLQCKTKNILTATPQDLNFLGKTQFFNGELVFFYVTTDQAQVLNTVYHVNKYCDLIQVSGTNTYNFELTKHYNILGTYTKINQLYALIKFNYHELIFSDKIETFLVIQRTNTDEEFDESWFQSSGQEQKSEIHYLAQYDSMFFIDQVLIACQDSYTNDTYNFVKQATTFQTQLVKIDNIHFDYKYPLDDCYSENQVISIYRVEQNFNQQALMDQVNDNTNNISLLQAFQATQESLNTSLQNQITSNTSNISTNTTNINSINQQISTLNTQQTNQDQLISTNTNNISTNTTNITNLNNQINQINADQQTQDDTIAGVRSDCDMNTTNITDVTLQVADNCVKYTDIIDNLNSTSTVDALSANQGYILNNLINSKSPYTVLTAGTYDLQNLDFGTYQIRNDKIILYSDQTHYTLKLTLPKSSIMFVFGTDGYHIMYDFYNLGYYYMLPSVYNVFYYNWYVGAVNKSDTIYKDYLKSSNILDVLTSTSKKDCLSANQGYVLNNLITDLTSRVAALESK